MTSQEQNNYLKKAAAIAGVSLAVLLIVLKSCSFYKRQDSLAIFSSLADSVTDLFASAVSFAAVYFSTKPATKEHRYGYGKSEALSAFLQAIFVGASGIFVIADGIKRLIYPVQIEQTAIGIAVMLFSILATVLLVLFQTYVANKTNSLAIKADRAHYTVDFLTNATVVLSSTHLNFLSTALIFAAGSGVFFCAQPRSAGGVGSGKPRVAKGFGDGFPRQREAVESPCADGPGLREAVCGRAAGASVRTGRGANRFSAWR